MDDDKPKLGILTLQESEHILRAALAEEHYNDQRVITFIRSYLMEYSVANACRDAMISQGRGYQLMKSPDVKDAMERLEKKSASGANFQASALIRRMQEIVDANIMDVMRDDGTFKSKTEIPVWLQRCIKKFEAKYEKEKVLDANGIWDGKSWNITSGVLKIELHEVMKAAELLARDQGIFREVKVTQHELGKNAGAILLQASENRANQHINMIDVSPSNMPTRMNNTMPELIED